MGNARSRNSELRQSKDSSPDGEEVDEELLSGIRGTRLYSFQELLRATDNFSSNNKIGTGAFGSTYKGALQDGTVIAVKVVSGGSAEGEREFLNEISILARTDHENLVKFYGCCVEANHRILVFDYLKNGDLAQALLCSGPRSINFPWDVRRRICIGIAKGLAFLHDVRIVHRDIKAANVLLDDELNPKISDFGIATFLAPDRSRVTERVVGTMGYLAPEYAMRGLLTLEADTYSFGVLVLEIVSGRRHTSGEGKYILERAWDLHKMGELLSLVDKAIMGDFDREEAYKYLITCLLCTQNDLDLRPDMSTVIDMLTGKKDVSGESLLRPGPPSPHMSPGADEGEMLESDYSYSPGSISSASLHFSGPLWTREKDGCPSLMYSKEVKSSYPDSTASLITVFTYKKMKKITGNFKQSISAGHHRIFLGFISKELPVASEPLQVAVKTYDGDDRLYQDKDNWLAQVSLFEKLSHPNLVQLIGYCYEAKHRILMYKYMARGSLADNLFSKEQSPLSWDVRMKIAIDAAIGLAYLHRSERPVIHRNIKPSKILLDSDYNGKIFGFGLATAGPEGYESEISDIVVGTLGYIAPEYFRTGRVSAKSDVYSFGVVLVELISGRKWRELLLEKPGGLVELTREFLEEERSLHALMDARLKENYPIQGAKEVVKLAKKCLDENPQQRPFMREIVDCLNCLPEHGTSSLVGGLKTVEKVQKVVRSYGSTSQSQAMNLGTQVEDRGTILMQAGLKWTEAPTPEKWLSAEEIYLMQSQVTELPEGPRCQTLKALYLHRNCKLRTIPTSFFEYMPALQVLNLSRTRIKTLPESFFQLFSLKKLFLNHCELLTVLPPKIGELKQLEVLDLHGTEIINLPEEVVKLTNLGCLELSFCGDIKSERNESESNVLFPEGTISALSKLEELSIDVDPEDERWERSIKAIFDEICGLRMLNTLKLYVPYVEHLMNFNLYSMPIDCFKFTVGHHANRIMSRFPQDLQYELEQWDRCLKYVNGVGAPTDIKKVLHHATAFFLDRHATATKLSEFGIENMQQLKCCIIGECNEVRYLLDGFDFSEEESNSEIVSEYTFAGHSLGSLEFLYVYYMKSLKKIFTGPYRKCFCNLKYLTLQTCPQLAIIFTPESLGDLSNLEELTVEDCDVVTSLVTCEDSTAYENSCFLPKLKKMSLHYLPRLVSISHGLRMAPDLELISLCYCPMLSFSIEEVGNKHSTKIKEEESLTLSIISSFESLEGKSVEGDSSKGKSVQKEISQSRGSEEKSIEGDAEPSQSSQGIMEEHIRLSSQLQVKITHIRASQQQRLTSVSSLQPRLAEHSLQPPPVPDAKSIVSNVEESDDGVQLEEVQAEASEREEPPELLQLVEVFTRAVPPRQHCHLEE
ncbi:uncharacterized protein LOC116203778 isoform X2 [Punica granatum]|uniref:Uncharacterized protein LOC116203778 isoform X2 n=1 Tax=Punica granatum TaxID=22663 RepID=A0A6P8D4Z7_PUNGR|nr:uncharacterized protein LOC116203778 isoform X2 [Punica granatum]